VTAALRRPFISLAVPNYRRYFVGQVVSLSGNWMQIVAEVWLVLQLTGSGLAVGLTMASQFAPILLFGAYGGLLADRFDKRTLLMATQAAMAVPAIALFTLAATGLVEVWMVIALAFLRGTVNALDNPGRQSFVIEMVGSERVVNAVSLNSVIVHCARMAGPAVAGIVIATAGVTPCFLLNALSFAAMIVALRRMAPADLDTPPRAPREAGALRASLRYVARTPELAVPLAMMALVGTLSFNFQVLLPLLARFTFDGGPQTYALLVTSMGAGSVAGALIAGTRGRVTTQLLVGSSAAFGAFTMLAAAAPTLPLAATALVLVGAASVTFAAGVNSTLQLVVEPQMRGRVLALYSVVFLGSTPIGAPIAGALSEVAGPRAGLMLGALAAVLAAVGAYALLRRRGEPAVVGEDTAAVGTVPKPAAGCHGAAPTALAVTSRRGECAAHLVGRHDLAPERVDRDRHQLERARGEREPDDRHGERHGGHQVPEREPPAAQHEPQHVANR
jgi:MFS family permease